MNCVRTVHEHSGTLPASVPTFGWFLAWIIAFACGTDPQPNSSFPPKIFCKFLGMLCSRTPRPSPFKSTESRIMRPKSEGMNVFMMEHKRCICTPLRIQQLGVEIDHLDVRYLHYIKIDAPFPSSHSVPLCCVFSKHAEGNCPEVIHWCVGPNWHVNHNLQHCVPEHMKGFCRFGFRPNHTAISSIGGRQDGLLSQQRTCLCP